MRWEYQVPPGKLAVADGRKTYVYLPEERQVLVAPLDQDGARTGISFLLGRADLIGAYSIAWGPGPEGGPRPLMLTPRTPRQEYQYLLVTAGPDHLVRSLTVVDPLGSRVIYRFDHIRLVESLDDDLFRFEAPEGIEAQDIAPP